MARTELDQATQALHKAHRILITFSPRSGGDAVGSALALAKALREFGKQADVVSANFELPGAFRFLPGAKQITSQVASLRKFVVSVNLERTQLQDLSYSVAETKLHIYLTPKSGSFNAADISLRASEFTYDLIVSLDTPDLEALGELYHNNTEFFYATTIINLDHSAANEHYGQINLVNFNVPSTADLVFELLEQLNPSLIDPDVATCLFAGLTAATKSFSTPQVTPETLARAAKLVNLGARREEVVTHLYRTKQLPVLKLWGRALARLKSDSTRKLVWSLLQPDDFVKSGAAEADLSGVIDELIVNAPEAGTIILIYEVQAGTTTVFVQTSPGYHALDLLKPFEASGDRRRATASLRGKSVLEAEKIILDHVKQLIRPLE